jgi:hypothetical protein
VISIVPAAPLDPVTAAVRLAAGHDRVVTAVVADPGTDEVDAEALVDVVDALPVAAEPAEDDVCPQPASATAAAKATARRRRSVKN